MQTIDLHPQLIIAYTEKADGNMDERFSDRSVVMANRRKIYNKFDLNPRLIIEAKQINSDRILVLNSENTKMWVGSNIPGVDGFVTNQTDTGLLLKLADCVPVIIYDPEHHAMGIFHVGWQGAVKQIHLKGLSLMQTEYGTDPAQVLVWLGPCAKACCYTSDKQPDQMDDPTWQSFITPKDNAWSIDLPGQIVHGLKLSGIKAKNITQDEHCTVESDQLFSHVKAKTSFESESRFLVLTKLR